MTYLPVKYRRGESGYFLQDGRIAESRLRALHNKRHPEFLFFNEVHFWLAIFLLLSGISFIPIREGTAAGILLCSSGVLNLFPHWSLYRFAGRSGGLRKADNRSHHSRWRLIRN